MGNKTDFTGLVSTVIIIIVLIFLFIIFTGGDLVEGFLDGDSRTKVIPARIEQKPIAGTIVRVNECGYGSPSYIVVVDNKGNIHNFWSDCRNNYYAGEVGMFYINEKDPQEVDRFVRSH